MGNKPTTNISSCSNGKLCVTRSISNQPYYYIPDISKEAVDSLPFQKVMYASQNISLSQEIILNPSDELGYQRHPYRDQYYYVLSGQGTAEVSLDTFPLQAGSMLALKAGTPYNITNSSLSQVLVLRSIGLPAETNNPSLDRII